MPRVKVTRRAAKGPRRYHCLLLATLTDSLSEALPLSKVLHESAQNLDNSFYGCYVKRSRFNRKQRALDQKKLALDEKKHDLAATKWDLEVQKFISHARNIATEAKLMAAQQDGSAARAETAQVLSDASQKQRTFLELERLMAETQEEFSARDDDHYENQWVTHISHYFQRTSLQKKLKVLETTKNDLQSDVDAIKAECTKKLPDKSSDAGRKAKELEDQISQLTEIVRDLQGQIVTNENDASELATKLVELTGDLIMRDENLEAKTEESGKMENEATALAEEVQGFKRDLGQKELQWSKTIEQLKRAEQQAIEAKQQEAKANSHLEAANKEVTQLSSAVVAEKEKLRDSRDENQAQQEVIAALEKEVSALQKTKETLNIDVQDWKAVNQILHDKKGDLEKQLAILVSQKSEVEQRLEAASKEAREAKQNLFFTHGENNDLRVDLKALHERLELVAQQAAHSQAALQDKIDLLTAMRDSLLTRGDANMRLLKAAQAQAAEAAHALLWQQAPRAVAFANLATMKKRRASDESRSVNNSESSPPTSPETKAEGSESILKPSLNASAIEFTPRLVLSPTPSQGQAAPTTVSRHKFHVRPGNLLRQLRRPIKPSKRTETQLQELEPIVLDVQMQMMLRPPPGPPVRLPSGGRFSTAGSALITTIWRLNDNTALIVIQRSYDYQQSSCTLFDFDMAHFRSTISTYQVLCRCDQSAKAFLGNGGQMPAHDSMRVENSSTPPLSTTAAETSLLKAPSPPPKVSIQAVSGVAPENTRPRSEAQTTNKPLTSRSAQKPCRNDPHCGNLDCTFAHLKRAKRATIPCRNFVGGNCRWGAAYDFKHDTNVPQAPPPPPPPTSNASTATAPSVLPSAPEPADQIDEAQVKKRADEIKADPKNWRLTYHEAEVQARDEQKTATEAARAEAKQRAERATKKAADKTKNAAEVTKALAEKEFQMRDAAHSAKVQAKAEVIKKNGVWDMTLAEALVKAKDELKGQAPTR